MKETNLLQIDREKIIKDDLWDQSIYQKNEQYGSDLECYDPKSKMHVKARIGENV